MKANLVTFQNAAARETVSGFGLAAIGNSKLVTPQVPKPDVTGSEWPGSGEPRGFSESL
jgi:hypothetical protein